MTTLLKPEQAQLLVVDIQEKFRPVLFNAESMIEATRRLIAGCRLLGVPITVSEQYPKGLGHTVPELLAELEGEAMILEKTAFGCGECTEIADYLAKQGRQQVIVCGLEAHVCVNQTVIQLLESGYQVFLVEDAMGSRQEVHYRLALRKLAQLGAIPSCVEMVLFELLGTASNPQFKAVQKLVL